MQRILLIDGARFALSTPRGRRNHPVYQSLRGLDALGMSNPARLGRRARHLSLGADESVPDGWKRTSPDAVCASGVFGLEPIRQRRWAQSKQIARGTKMPGSIREITLNVCSFPTEKYVFSLFRILNRFAWRMPGSAGHRVGGGIADSQEHKNR